MTSVSSVVATFNNNHKRFVDIVKVPQGIFYCNTVKIGLYLYPYIHSGMKMFRHLSEAA